MGGAAEPGALAEGARRGQVVGARRDLHAAEHRLREKADVLAGDAVIGVELVEIDALAILAAVVGVVAVVVVGRGAGRAQRDDARLAEQRLVAGGEALAAGAIIDLRADLPIADDARATGALGEGLGREIGGGAGDRHRAPEEARQLIKGDAGRRGRAHLSRSHAERQRRHGAARIRVRMLIFLMITLTTQGADNRSTAR